MKKMLMVIFLSSLCLLQGCFVYGKKSKLTLDTVIKQKENLDSTLSSVNISNNQIIINGTGFSKVTTVKMKGTNLAADLNINSKSDSQIIATATSALSLLVGGTFDLIIGTVEAQSTYSITFTLQNGAVTASHLSSMGATSGQVLKYNGATWIASDLSSSQTYIGTWNASTQIPNLAATTPNSGDYYIVSVTGDYTVPNPDVHYDVGDWIMYNGSDWEKVASGLSSKLDLVGGTLTGDLVLDTLIKFKGGSNYVTIKASSSLVSDIVLTLPITTGTNGQVLTTNGSGVLTWTTPSASTPPSGSAGGDLSGSYPNPSVALIGGVTASGIASGANLANTSTNTNTVSTVVKRDGSGDFSAGTITATLNGTSTNVTGTVAVANGGTGGTTAVAARANLGLVIGSGLGEVMVFTTAMSCFPYEKLQVSAAPYFLTCVTDNGNTNYVLLAGRVGGQSLNGGTGASENLTLDSTAHATKGYVLINPTGGNVGIGTAGPSSPLQLSYTNTTTSGTNYGFQIKPTYNQVASTASNTDFLINRTQTSLGSGNQKLIDAQVGGVSQFSVTNNGAISALSLSTNGNISGVNLMMSSLFSNNGWSTSGWVVVDVGAGNANPIMNWIKGGVSKVIIDSNGSMGIGTASPGAKLQVGTLADGSVALANAWNLLSDERLKRDFEIIPDSLEKLLSLNGYYYYWNRGSDHSKKIGVKAQEVEKVFPEVISKGADGFLSVSYNHLVAAVIEAVKEFYAKWFEDSKAIHRQMAKLETENINLKKENGAMRARLDKIEKALNSK